MPTRKRCPNGSHKNKRTGLCEPKKARTLKNKRSITVNKDDECPICLISMDKKSTDAPLIKTKCKHVFHMACLQSQCGVKKTCPLCRTDISQDCRKIKKYYKDNEMQKNSLTDKEIQEMVFASNLSDENSSDFKWLEKQVKNLKFDKKYKYKYGHESIIREKKNNLGNQAFDKLTRYSDGENPFGKRFT